MHRTEPVGVLLASTPVLASHGLAYCALCVMGKVFRVLLPVCPYQLTPFCIAESVYVCMYYIFSILFSSLATCFAINAYTRHISNKNDGKY